jgi:hypothetical protein
MKDEKTFILWLAGSVISALVLVGLVSVANVNKTPPIRSLVSVDGAQGGKPMGKNEKCNGNKITTADGTNLCISNQPFAGDPNVKSEPAATEIQNASYRFTVVAPSDKPCQNQTGVTV